MSDTSTQQGSSLSAFLSTLIPVAAQAGAFVLIFLFLRGSLRRVYRPRTYLSTVPQPLRSEDLPGGRFNWVRPFFKFSDEYALNHQSLDGYLYLRFLKMMCFICFVGCCITWPVLFPVNATAGGSGKEFDMLSFANIPKSGKNRYYAHVFVGWIFFTFVIYVITREYIYFINLRNAYYMSPFHAARISSRTVLFTDVRDEYLDHDKLQRLFGNTARRVWLQKNTKDLDEDVEQRDKIALKLENAEITLSKKANKRRLKAEKKANKESKKTKGTKKSSEKQLPHPAGDTDANGVQHDGTRATHESTAQTANGEQGVPSAHTGSAPTRDVQDVDIELANPSSEYLVKKDRPTHRLGFAKLPCLGRKVDTIDWSRSELRTLSPKIQEQQAALRGDHGKLVPAIFVEFTTQQAAQAAYRRMDLWKKPNMFPRAISSTPSDIIWKNLRIKKSERTLRAILANTFLTLMIIFWAIPVAVVGAISNINYLTDKVPFLSFINDIPPVVLGVVTGLLPSIMLSILMALVPIVCRLMGKLGGKVTLSGAELYCQHWYMAFQVVQVFLITTFASGASSVVTSIIDDPGSATTLLAQNLPKASNFFISYVIVQMLGIAAGNLLNIGALVMLRFVGKYLDGSPRKIYTRYMTLAGLGWGTLYPQFGNLGIIALAYSIIAPLLMGFACVGFALTYFAMRYNIFYVLGNKIDTQGRAYARGIQQLMTGVYISEVCLLGLFAINTAPGPIVLMAVFLGLTAVYHALMRKALKPHVMYLPDSLEVGPSFNFADHHAYDNSKADGVPPSEWVTPNQNKLAAMREKLYSSIWAPQKFKTFEASKRIVAEQKPPEYLAEEEESAYLNPSMAAETPNLWIVRDSMGISQKECLETREVIPISDRHAHFDGKNKIQWDQEILDEDPTEAPIYEKEVYY